MTRQTIVACTLWLLMGGGTYAVIAHESRESARLLAPREWPQDSMLRRVETQPTLLVFIHPNCPCTRATVAQLATILGDVPPSRRPHVVVVARPAAVQDWRASRLMTSLAALPGAQIVEDRDEREAHRFGASVSGQVLLYDAEGTLRFDGGVTAGRGHQGANDAADALAHLLAAPTNRSAETALFGCSIDDAPGAIAR